MFDLLFMFSDFGEQYTQKMLYIVYVISENYFVFNFSFEIKLVVLKFRIFIYIKVVILYEEIFFDSPPTSPYPMGIKRGTCIYIFQ